MRRNTGLRNMPGIRECLSVSIISGSLIIPGLILAAVSMAAGKPLLSRYEYVQLHMGTQFRIVLYAPDGAKAGEAAGLAFARITELDNIMSDYRMESELNRLCRLSGGPPVRVSDDLFKVLALSKKLSERTGGAFDITAGPVIRLWRRARRTLELPDEARLGRARLLTGYRFLHLDESQKSVRLEKVGMQLDLGAIAKGYAADAAMDVLKSQGIRIALVAAGGDIVVSESPPGENGWSIAIAPLSTGGKSAGKQAVLLANAAVSTSGDAQQFVEIDGVRYSHIVDPRTGIGLKGRSSVTVVAPNGATSDSLAPALSVLGPQRGLDLIEQVDGAAAAFSIVDETGRRVIVSKGWNKIPGAGESIK